MSYEIPYNKILVDYARANRKNPTLSEKLLWFELKNKKLNGYDFHRQKPFGYYIFDFYCHQLKLLIECDGETHNHEITKVNDKRKSEYAESFGYKVLRFYDAEIVHNMSGVLERIYDYIKDYESLKKQ
ncbi:MAG: DNA methylase [Ignavibacteriae bacterium HGW-Ignavibacteriae-1]|jgi:very-short-patch-repair endonuclease|nr:MAG: DNA methylase [Ignavibacteriae bacterium HGW-Ignavibacteriae-1]